MSNRHLQPHERAQFDQDAALVSELIAIAREHRQGECAVAADLPCIGDALYHYLTDHLTNHNLSVVAAVCISRLADLKPTDPTEGIKL